MPPKKVKKKAKKKVTISENVTDAEDQSEKRKSSHQDSAPDIDVIDQKKSDGSVSREGARGTVLRSFTAARERTSSRGTTLSFQSAGVDSDMSIEEDIVTLTVPETSQKIVHCLVGKDLFVDKTWCMVKKADILEDVAIQDTNSPFFSLTQKILAYKPSELLIGYEPFSSEPNQFMLCTTEAGRDNVLSQLEDLKTSYFRRIQQSKAVEPRQWESLGSEQFVDQFQIKRKRKMISLEWIGDISKRCLTEPNFEDCDPDDMKNGYTCLVPSDKEKFELIFRKTQETGTQAVAEKTEISVQTDPEIPTNACTQYAPETEITITDPDTSQSAIKSQDLNAFFKKYLDYLLECLNYNEVYDLYHDDYPALYVTGEETQVQQLGTYNQYQSFTDVAAIEGKLVISSSWHPNYTGIVAVAYANEIPCLMKELEFDSDQTDYEEEKTDEEGEPSEEPDLGPGAQNWLVDERRERESTGENTDMYDKAMKKLRDIETAKMVWDAKIGEGTEEIQRHQDDLSSERTMDTYEYREYREPEPEDTAEKEGATPEVSEVLEGGEEEEEQFGMLGKEDTVSQKTSKTSFREQLEADIEETPLEMGSPSTQIVDDDGAVDYSRSSRLQPTEQTNLQELSRSGSEGRRRYSEAPSRKRSHHRKKHRKNVPRDRKYSLQVDEESVTTFQSQSVASSCVSETIGKIDFGREMYFHEHELFDEVTDEEEIKEKQDELPLLELNNPVLIWSFVDDLTPKLRLDSPYEVQVVSFCRHNGNLIAGGTASGQVVLWDITGRIEELEKPEALTQNQQIFRKRMEDLMNWRRDVRSKRRVRISAISGQADSHLEKVTNLMWVGPTAVVTDTLDILKNPSPEPNLQFLSCSIFGDFKLWDLRAEPVKVDYKKQLQLFKTKERFGRPSSLDTGLSPFNQLHRRWKPLGGLVTMYKSMPVLLTGFYPHTVPIKYVRAHPKIHGVKEVLEDRVQYEAIAGEFDTIPHQLYIGNLFGQAGTIIWEPPEVKPPEGEIFQHTCRFWDSYHDGPILRVSKHPFIPSLCLTVGGHVFAIWHNANDEEPILTKRYFGMYVTDGMWSGLRPSLMRIARSDGVVEIWDLIIQNHAPATTIIVSGRVITNLSPPILPEVRGLLGVADYNSAFRLFFIPQQFRVWSECELNRLMKFINREPERRKKMKEWSKWWRENNVNPDREEKKQAEEKKKLDEEVRLEKEKQEEARKKYNEEVYKWYMRRRGKPFLWKEEAEEKWRAAQEEHMHEVVMAKKKIDRTEMEMLMRPIVREEKNEAQKHAKANERLKQADNIFRQTIELIFPKSSRTVSTAAVEQGLSEECRKLIEHYFGENFENLADEQDDIVKRSPWLYDFECPELLEKYNALRMLFNDRRRKRNKTLRWLRKKLREELLKEGRKVHIRKSHTARYPKRKIKRRQECLDWLKQTYGDDYNVYWDKHHPCRRFADRKFRYGPERESQFLIDYSEPEVEDEETTEIFAEEKVKSSLEMITDVGIEHIPEETFAGDLDTALITLESRSSLGVKSIPSLVFDDRSRGSAALTRAGTTSLVFEDGLVPPEKYLSVPAGPDSPQHDSDLSIPFDESEDTSSILDNQMHELDYIQQPIGTKINTLQTKKVASHQKREISEGVKIKLEETSDEEETDDETNDRVMDYETEADNEEVEEKESKTGEEEQFDIVPDEGDEEPFETTEETI